METTSAVKRHRLTFSQRLVVANWIQAHIKDGVLLFNDTEAAARCCKETEIPCTFWNFRDVRLALKIAPAHTRSINGAGRSGASGSLYARIRQIEAYLDQLDPKWREPSKEEQGL